MATDRSTYSFNGKTYGKGRLVLAVVEQYVSDNPGLAKAKLEEIFPATLQGSIGVVSSIEEAEGKYKGKRHFVKSAIRLANATIAVCNQWGSDNIDMFLQHATEELGYAIENDSGAEDLENDDSESQSSKTHTYLAGVEVEDEGLDDLISSVLKFVDAAYYKLSKNPEIYLIGTSNKDGEFLGSHKELQSIKVFQGSYSHDDDEPNEENVREVFLDNEGLIFLDEGYSKVWLAFKYPEEISDEFENPGDHWIYDFQQLAQNLDDLALVGYNSKFESIIWQQWAGGEFDEGAISNQDLLDHYSGSNIESVHLVNLSCFKILD